MIRILLALWAMVVQTLRPLITQPFPRRSARVVRLAVSRPESGSVTAKHIRSRPSISRGIALAFWASEPNFTIGMGPKMFRCTALAPEKPAPDSATACMTRAASVSPRPAPPRASGMAAPSQPPEAMADTKASGKSPVSSTWRQ